MFDSATSTRRLYWDRDFVVSRRALLIIDLTYTNSSICPFAWRSGSDRSWCWSFHFCLVLSLLAGSLLIPNNVKHDMIRDDSDRK